VGAATSEGPDAAEATEGGGGIPPLRVPTKRRWGRWLGRPTRRRRRRGRRNPAAAGPSEAKVGAVAGPPDAAEVEAEVGAAANHPPAVEEGWARIRAAPVEEPLGACSPPRGDQAGGTVAHTPRVLMQGRKKTDSY
jgi:hypothetical protein